MQRILPYMPTVGVGTVRKWKFLYEILFHVKI